MMSLFTVDEFLNGVKGLTLPENEPQVRAKPRASGLADCARKQWFAMTNEPVTNYGEIVQAFTNEQNRHLEDTTCTVLEAIGMPVVDRQISLPEDYPVTGHPDGAFADGWGFEHKVLGYYSFMQVFKNGLYTEKPGYVTQAALYGDALGWDNTQFVILAGDHTKLRSDSARSRQPWAMREDWHPKVQLPVIDNRQLAPLVPQMKQRAANLSTAAAAGTMVEREYSGTERFPCGYCEWADRCNQEGEGGVVVTANPL
jgi:hypothetical protein